MFNSAIMPSYDAGLIKTEPGLPCAMRRDGHRCNQPATVSWSEPILTGPNSGSFYVIPICRDCARSAMELYGQGQAQHGQVQQASEPRLNGLAALSSLKGA